MEYFLFIIKSAIFDFSRNKGRTLLTSLGILIGVLAVVLLIAFGLGLKQYIKDQFESLGTNLIFVTSGKILSGGGFRNSPGALYGARFDDQDIRKLKNVKNVEYMVPVFFKSAKITGGGNSEVGDIFASSEDIFPVINLEVEYGKVYTKKDVQKRARVVVLGPKLATKLFPTERASVGQTIKMDGISFKVIGVLKGKGGGGFGGPDYDTYSYIPNTTGFIFNPDKKYVRVFAKSEGEGSLSQVKKDMEKVLLKRYDEEEFSVIEQTEILNAVSSIFSILNLVLVAIAAISLIVGGIGIMNIMYVTVTERIKEIGIRRAIGARKKDILLQFLVESVLLSLFGGFLGLLFAFLIVFFIQKLFPAYIDFGSVILALGVSSGIGIVFGVFPAKKAADLSPIEAIRYE